MLSTPRFWHTFLATERFWSPVFLGDDLLAWLTLAIGGALAVGTVLALVRPPASPDDGDLVRPPLARSVVMIVLGSTAALWGLASLVAHR